MEHYGFYIRQKFSFDIVFIFTDELFQTCPNETIIFVMLSYLVLSEIPYLTLDFLFACVCMCV